MSQRQYASLVGPLLGLYLPLPFDDDQANRIALNTSKLQKLWGGVYSEKQVDAQQSWDGFKIKLPPRADDLLDYDREAVRHHLRQRGMELEDVLFHELPGCTCYLLEASGGSLTASGKDGEHYEGCLCVQEKPPPSMPRDENEADAAQASDRLYHHRRAIAAVEQGKYALDPAARSVIATLKEMAASTKASTDPLPVIAEELGTERWLLDEGREGVVWVDGSGKHPELGVMQHNGTTATVAMGLEELMDVIEGLTALRDSYLAMNPEERP